MGSAGQDRETGSTFEDDVDVVLHYEDVVVAEVGFLSFSRRQNSLKAPKMS